MHKLSVASILIAAFCVALVGGMLGMRLGGTQTTATHQETVY